MIYRKLLTLVTLFIFGLLTVACTSQAEPAVEASPTIANTVESISTPDGAPTAVATDISTPTAEPDETDPPVDALSLFVTEWQAALTQRDFAALQVQMSDPFVYGPYRSEASSLTPANMAAQLENLLPAGATVQFHSESDVMALLGGQDPMMMLGPDVVVTAVWHTSGWGTEGQDEAILLLVEEADGRFAWKAMVYAFDGFMPESAELPISDEQPAPIGLFYSQPDGSLWQVGAEGNPEQLYFEEGMMPVLSPDGKHAYFQVQGDLWLLEVAFGETRRLTSDHDDQGTHLVGYHKWVDNQTILSGVLLDWASEGGPNFGHPALIDIETGEVTMLDADHLMNSYPAISSEGAVAYTSVQQSADDTQTTWVYDPETGVNPFIPAEFANASEGFYTSPAWSADGRYLAWLVSDGMNVQPVVFDLEGGSATTLPAFGTAAFGGPLPNPIFSEDSNWFVLRQFTTEPTTSGLWLYTLDGNEPVFIAQNGGESLWVNEHLLLFIDYDENFNGQLQQYDVLTGVRSTVLLPNVFQIFGIVQP